MSGDTLAALHLLSDDELVARLKDFAARQREAVVELVAHLSELETRDIHQRGGLRVALRLLSGRAPALAITDGPTKAIEDSARRSW